MKKSPYAVKVTVYILEKHIQYTYTYIYNIYNIQIIYIYIYVIYIIYIIYIYNTRKTFERNTKDIDKYPLH